MSYSFQSTKPHVPFRSKTKPFSNNYNIYVLEIDVFSFVPYVVHNTYQYILMNKTENNFKLTNQKIGSLE